MKLRKLEKSDISEVVELWYETSVKAHDFISPEYWKKNKEFMATKYLPNSETYVAIENNDIIGFVSMIDNLLAAIFVRSDKQGKGVGRKLMEYVKKRREIIQLKVYKDNLKSCTFYQKQGFKIISENLDKNTNKTEYLMEWKKLD